jgi:hypothetical protein
MNARKRSYSPGRLFYAIIGLAPRSLQGVGPNDFLEEKANHHGYSIQRTSCDGKVAQLYPCECLFLIPAVGCCCGLVHDYGTTNLARSSNMPRTNEESFLLMIRKKHYNNQAAVTCPTAVAEATATRPTAEAIPPVTRDPITWSRTVRTRFVAHDIMSAQETDQTKGQQACPPLTAATTMDSECENAYGRQMQQQRIHFLKYPPRLAAEGKVDRQCSDKIGAFGPPACCRSSTT